VERIDARISGSGNIIVETGSSIIEYLSISGSGNIDLANVPAKEAEAITSGSGDTKVNISDKLKANISGSGSILYRGNPTVTSQISGSGTVRPL
jgi:hypothetical protein